jgi:UDP-N-acetylmuramate--alanine ligase
MVDPAALELEPLRRIHIIGAGGIGMSGLAKILAGLGHVVTGSDLKPGTQLDALGDLHIETWVGHRPDRMAGVDLVAASSAVPDRDPEIEAARRAGVPVWGRPDLLDALPRRMPAIGFTGTHGKTTSTAMAVTAVQALGFDPTFLVGGQMVDLNTGAHLGDAEPFILEADEAFGTFRRLHLTGLAVTNIEPDHLDYYGNVAALEEAFSLVANRVAGPVVGCADDPGVRRLAERAPLIAYGTHPAATWRIEDLRHGRGDVAFTLVGPEAASAVRIPRPGSHIARNAAGVLALLGEMGYDLEAAAGGLSRFAGVRRRFEIRGRVRGVTVVDDYAHHPTEIAATVTAGRHGGWERVIAVFQPHRYTRTADLAPEFGAPLAVADRVIVTDVYPADEAPLPGVSGKLVAEAVRAAGGESAYVPNLMDVPGAIADIAREGDVILLLGAGDITSIADEVVAAVGSAP